MTFKNLILSLVTVFMCIGCLRTRSDIKELEMARETSGNIQDLQKSNAENTERFSQINSDLRDLNGRIEVLENRIKVTQQEKEDSLKKSQEQNESVQNKLNLLQETLAKLETQMNALNEARIQESQKELKKDNSETTAQDLLTQADDSFTKKDWKKAILDYTKFRETYPKSKKDSQAIYKIASSFEQLGMKDEAITFYQELADKYPKFIEIKKVKTKIKALKK
jgi:TolA-binding protein